MASLDHWLVHAARVTGEGLGIDAQAALLNRLAGERSPAAWAARRESRRAIVCAAMAAVLTFGGAGWFATDGFARSRPTWVAAPSASSPYALLVER